MTEKEWEQKLDEAVRAYGLEQKRERDRETIEAYERRLRGKRMQYSRAVTSISEGGRRNRALALGETCLQAWGEVEKLSWEHKLLEGTLYWTFLEEKVKDDIGKKGYRYTVVFHVAADEPAMTEEEIRAEIEETEKRIEAETREMYGIQDEGVEDEPDPEERPAAGAPEEDAEAGGGGGAEETPPWDE